MKLKVSALIVIGATTVWLAACSTGPKVKGDAQIPVNIAPAQNSSLVYGSETDFVWQAAPNATHYDFHIYDKTDGSIFAMTKRLDARKICNENRCQYRLKVDVPVHPGHSWRVRSVNYLGVSSWNRNYFDMVGDGVSASRSTVGATTPATPVVIAPTDEVIVSAQGNVTFRWQASAEASVYDFNVFNVVEGSYVNRSTDMPVSSICSGDICTLTTNLDLPASEKHVWRVRAGSPAGKGKWKRQRFQTM